MKKLLLLLLLPLLFACSKDDDKAGGTIDHTKQAAEYQNLLIGGNWIHYDQWGTPTSFYVFSEDKSSLKGNNLFQKYEVVSADNKTARGRSSGNYYISWSGGYSDKIVPLNPVQNGPL